MNFDFKRVRLNKLMPKERIIQLRGHQPGGVPPRAARRLHPAAGGGVAPRNPDTDWLIHSPSELVEHSVDLGASPRAIICWGRLAKVWTLLVRRRRWRSTPRTFRTWRRNSQPPHLARPARGEPWADGGRRHQGHPRARGDP